ncbi:hypothetical protein ACHAXT_000589 [Thalassiosira profunda]
MSYSMISRGARHRVNSGRWLSSRYCDDASSGVRRQAFPSSNANNGAPASFHRCYSALPIDTIKQSIKSSLLEEAAKKDSPFWDEKPTPKGPPHALNGMNGHAHPGHGGPVDIEKRLSAVVDVDTPISKPDPLDDWYLEAVSPNTEAHLRHAELNGFPAGEISARIPDCVAPLDPQINDPFHLSRPDVHDISATIGRDLIGTDHPVLNSAARYFFTGEDGKGKGKQVRPVMVMLFSRAVMEMSGGLDTSSHHQDHILKSQRRLAEITEMIHTASLFHDDVIDEADTRRGQPAAHKAFRE